MNEYRGFGGPGRDFNTSMSGGMSMNRRNSDPTYFGGGSPTKRTNESWPGRSGGSYSLLSRGGNGGGGRRGFPGGRGVDFGALKFAAGSLPGGGGGPRGGFPRNNYRRQIRGVPAPVRGGRGGYPGGFKPRGRGGSFPFRGGNRPRYDVGQLKERSQIPESEWNVCWEFNTKRGCRRGSRCKWKHISFETGGVVHPVTQEQLNSGLCPTISGGAPTGPSPAAIELAEKLGAVARSPPPVSPKTEEKESDNKEQSKGVSTAGDDDCAAVE